MGSLVAYKQPGEKGEESPVVKCRLCTVRLSEDEDDDFEQELCGSCMSRPEARRMGIPAVAQSAATAKPAAKSSKFKSAREFTVAEKALIKKVHGYMPPQQLLNILNERLVFDLGPDAAPYTMDQLYTEIGDASTGAPAGGHDFASLRKLLSKAQRAGVLDAIDEQVVNDFAVVFSLNQKQALVLKDIILQAKEE